MLNLCIYVFLSVDKRMTYNNNITTWWNGNLPILSARKWRETVEIWKKIFPISHRLRATATTATRRRQIDRHRPKSVINGIREENTVGKSAIPVGRYRAGNTRTWRSGGGSVRRGEEDYEKPICENDFISVEETDRPIGGGPYTVATTTVLPYRVSRASSVISGRENFKLVTTSFFKKIEKDLTTGVRGEVTADGAMEKCREEK